MSRKIDATLEALERSKMLTADGKNWLIAACDPFHDSDLRLSGYPDLSTQSTVVQLVKRQLTVSVPTSGNGAVTSPNNWDCSIALFPTLRNNIMNYNQTFNGVGGVANPVGANTLTTGGLVVNCGPASFDLWPSQLIQQPNVTTYSTQAGDFLKGSTRIIGMGFEVVNTTSDLYRQGQVTAWRMPDCAYTNITATLGSTPPSNITYEAHRLPPPNVAEAQLLYGSRSWSAEEGAYVVCRQNRPTNPMTLPQYRPLAFLTLDPTGASPFTSYTTASSLTNPYQGSLPDIWAPYDISGVHFTGLSYQTTLTVNVRWLIERAPSPAEPDLVVLATPSANYDPLALELYTRCLQGMPPGVMLSENPLGEWFRSVLGKVSDLAPKIGGLLTPLLPMAGTIGSAVGAAARGAQGLIKEKKKKKAEPQRPKTPGSASTTVLPHRRREPNPATRVLRKKLAKTTLKA